MGKKSNAQRKKLIPTKAKNNGTASKDMKDKHNGTAKKRQKGKKRKKLSNDGRTSSTAETPTKVKEVQHNKIHRTNDIQQSLASKLKRLRGTADSTPYPPAWKGNLEKKYRSLSPENGDDFFSCLNTSYKGVFNLLFFCDTFCSHPKCVPYIKPKPILFRILLGNS